MRRLKRNQKQFTYSLISSLSQQTDSNGHLTGKGSVVYEQPVTAKGCIVFRGTSAYKPYGMDEEWSVQIIPDNPLPVTVGTKITIDSKDYYVLSHPRTMNEQRIFCK